MGNLFGKKPKGPAPLKGAEAYSASLDALKENTVVTPMARDFGLGLRKKSDKKEKKK